MHTSDSQTLSEVLSESGTHTHSRMSSTVSLRFSLEIIVEHSTQNEPMY